MNHCPSSEQLRRLLADDLSGPEAEGVETHLEVCAGCQQALEQLTAEAGLSRGAEGQGEGDGEFLRRLKQQPPTGAWPAPDQQKPGAEEGQGLGTTVCPVPRTTPPGGPAG